MAELGYGDFDLLSDRIMIEDSIYDSTPDSWQRGTEEEAVRGGTIRTLTHTRKDVVPHPFSGKNWYGFANEEFTGSQTNLYVDSRYTLRQSWSVGWSGAFMSVCMRDHLMTLYTLQKGFWLRYDDEMSRDCATLKALDDARTQFVTPTYPIAFYRSGDVEGQRADDLLYIELKVDDTPVDWATNPYYVDADTGLVVFENGIAEGSIVTMKYLWRAYVRIKEISLKQLAMAQHVYNGQIVFEQLTPPNRADRFDEFPDYEPCRVCDEVAEETCLDFVGPNQSTQGDDSLTDWSNVANIESLDASYASCALATNGDYTEHLMGLDFNFDGVQNEDIKLSKVDGVIYHDAPNSNLAIVSVRLVYQGELIGPNKADGSAVDDTYAFEISMDELEGYEFTRAELLAGALGLAVQYQALADTQTARVDYMELAPCWADVYEEPPSPTICGCFTDGPPEEDIVNQVLTCTHRLDEVDTVPYEVPADHYVHGVEIVSLIEGAEKGCEEPPTDVAVVGVRLKLDTGGSTYSSWFEKSNQPVRTVDHAYLNYLDATSDLSWGGKNDCWGKPIGGWSPALVNAYGFKLEVDWATDCNPTLTGNWTYARTFDGHAVGSRTNNGPYACQDAFDDAWGSNGENTNRSILCEGIFLASNDTLSLLQDGDIIHEFTWAGGGDPPDFVDVLVASYAHARNLDFDPDTPRVYEASNGLGDTPVMDGAGETLTAYGVHNVRVPVVGGVATVTVPVRSYAEQGPNISANNVPLCEGKVESEAWINDNSCIYPDLLNVDVVVHHSSVCAMGPNCYQEATVTGWPTVYKGESCGLAISSLGSTDGAFSLLADRFDFPAIGANARIVGIRVTGEYRVNPDYVRAGNLTFKAHIGSYDAGRTGKTVAYPQTNEWTEFSIGSNGDFWDYGSVFAETGVTYPTATGAQLATLFQLEMLGDNDTGYAYEFREIKVEIFFFEVCDSL